MFKVDIFDLCVIPESIFHYGFFFILSFFKFIAQLLITDLRWQPQ